MTSLSGFDDWLNRLVDEQAALAGQTVPDYVAQAVATRLMGDIRRRDDEMAVFFEHLSEVGIVLPRETSGPDPVVTDPARLEALQATGLLDAPRDVAFDRITDMAATALGAPGAAITLVDSDRQFFVAMHGSATDEPEVRETPLARSVCQYAVAAGQPLVVADARTDPVLKYNPAVTDGTVVAYLGIPLIDSSHHAIGTLCVWDTTARDWTSGHVTTLRDLAHLASARIFAE